MENVSRFPDSSQFLDRLLERILSLHRLEFGDGERGAYQPIFQGSGQTIHIIPMAHNQVLTDILFEDGRQHAVVGVFARAIERLIGEVTQPWSKPEAQQHE